MVRLASGLNVTTLGIAASSATVLYVFYRFFSSYLAARSWRLETAVNELAVLGTPRKADKNGSKPKGTVVIVGGSISGLFSAVACSHHYDQVVLLEADEGADEATPNAGKREKSDGYNTWKTRRSRLYQANALHLFQPYILYACRKWFPNFDEQLKATGARISPFNTGLRFSGIYLADPDPNLFPLQSIPHHPNIPNGAYHDTIFTTRANFEPLLRRLVHKYYKNVTTIKATANGINLKEMNKAGIKEVQSVSYTEKGISKTIDAALVIDCSGSAAVGAKWLPRVGVTAPKAITHNPNITYGSIALHVPDHVKPLLPIPGGWKNMEWTWSHMPLDKIGTTATWLTKSDDNTLMFGYGGFGCTSETMPHTCEGLKEFHRSLKVHPRAPKPDEWICDVLDVLEKQGWEHTIHIDHTISSCTLIEYQNVPDLPKNFIAIGDSIMRASPVYGLGCTKASVGAATLEGLLHETELGPNGQVPAGFSKKFLDLQHSRTLWSWETSKIADYGYPFTIPAEGESLKAGQGIREFAYRWIVRLDKDPEGAAYWYHSRLWLYPQLAALPMKVAAKTIWYWLTVE